MSSDLTITDKQDGFTDNQIAALQQMGVQDASQGDLAVFFHEVQRTGLDPFARQIYMIGRRTKVDGQWVTKYTIQTGIDGFRLIARRAADRSHEAFGEPVTAWCGADAVWREAWLDAKHPPLAAKVVVQRGQGTFTGVATLEEYQGTRKVKDQDGSWHAEPTSMWKSKPAIMLAKCAEALALRKAFPQDLSGLYGDDEIQESDPKEDQKPAQQDDQPVQAEVMASKEQQEQVAALMRQGGVSTASQAQIAFKALVGKPISLPEQMTHDEAAMLLEAPNLVVSRTRQALGQEAPNAAR